jgi:hypothetical protein
MPIPLIIAGGLAAVAVGSQLISAQAQANAIRAQAEFQAAIAELNAQMAEIDSVQAIRDGRTQEARYLGEVTQVQDAQSAAFASQDVQVKGDATGDLISQSSLNAALNIVDIQNQAAINSSKFRNEAQSIRNQSAVNTYNASNYAQSTLISGYAGAAMTAANFGMQAYGLMGKTGGGLQTAKPVMTSESMSERLNQGIKLESSGFGNQTLSNTYGHNHWNNFYG